MKKRLCQQIFLIVLVLDILNCQSKQPLPEPTPSPSAVAKTTENKFPALRTREFDFDFSNSAAKLETDHLINKNGLTIDQPSISGSAISEPIPTLMEAPEPFLAISAKWKSITSSDQKLRVSVRASADQINWSEWQQSSPDGDPRTQAGLFFFAPENRFIQYRIEMECDERKKSPVLKKIIFRTISPGATPDSVLENNKASNRFFSRLKWGCPTAPRSIKYQTAAIHHFIIHHTATSNSLQDWPAVVRTIWNFHVMTNGWLDLGYHYLIDPNGVIYEGRAGGDKSVGTHFSCANTGTLGIAMLGNFELEAPTQNALESLKNLLVEKSQYFHLDPTGIQYHPGTGLKLPSIAGHREANASKFSKVCKGTKCPGEKLFALIPRIRSEVKNLIEQNQK